jgi:hypothetical protein
LSKLEEGAVAFFYIIAKNPESKTRKEFSECFLSMKRYIQGANLDML